MCRRRLKSILLVALLFVIWSIGTIFFWKIRFGKHFQEVSQPAHAQDVHAKTSSSEDQQYAFPSAQDQNRPRAKVHFSDRNEYCTALHLTALSFPDKYGFRARLFHEREKIGLASRRTRTSLPKQSKPKRVHKTLCEWVLSEYPGFDMRIDDPSTVNNGQILVDFVYRHVPWALQSNSEAGRRGANAYESVMDDFSDLVELLSFFEEGCAGVSSTGPASLLTYISHYFLIPTVSWNVRLNGGHMLNLVPFNLGKPATLNEKADEKENSVMQIEARIQSDFHVVFEKLYEGFSNFGTHSWAVADPSLGVMVFDKENQPATIFQLLARHHDYRAEIKFEEYFIEEFRPHFFGEPGKNRRRIVFNAQDRNMLEHDWTSSGIDMEEKCQFKSTKCSDNFGNEDVAVAYCQHSTRSVSAYLGSLSEGNERDQLTDIDDWNSQAQGRMMKYFLRLMQNTGLLSQSCSSYMGGGLYETIGEALCATNGFNQQLSSLFPFGFIRDYSCYKLDGFFNGTAPCNSFASHDILEQIQDQSFGNQIDSAQSSSKSEQTESSIVQSVSELGWNEKSASHTDTLSETGSNSASSSIPPDEIDESVHVVDAIKSVSLDQLLTLPDKVYQKWKDKIISGDCLSEDWPASEYQSKHPIFSQKSIMSNKDKCLRLRVAHLLSGAEENSEYRLNLDGAELDRLRAIRNSALSTATDHCKGENPTQEKSENQPRLSGWLDYQPMRCSIDKANGDLLGCSEPVKQDFERFDSANVRAVAFLQQLDMAHLLKAAMWVKGVWNAGYIPTLILPGTEKSWTDAKPSQLQHKMIAKLLFDGSEVIFSGTLGRLSKILGEEELDELVMFATLMYKWPSTQWIWFSNTDRTPVHLNRDVPHKFMDFPDKENSPGVYHILKHAHAPFSMSQMSPPWSCHHYSVNAESDSQSIPLLMAPSLPREFLGPHNTAPGSKNKFDNSLLIGQVSILQKVFQLDGLVNAVCKAELATCKIEHGDIRSKYDKSKSFHKSSTSQTNIKYSLENGLAGLNLLDWSSFIATSVYFPLWISEWRGPTRPKISETFSSIRLSPIYSKFSELIETDIRIFNSRAHKELITNTDLLVRCQAAGEAALKIICKQCGGLIPSQFSSWGNPYFRNINMDNPKKIEESFAVSVCVNYGLVIGDDDLVIQLITPVVLETEMWKTEAIHSGISAPLLAFSLRNMKTSEIGRTTFKTAENGNSLLKLADSVADSIDGRNLLLFWFGEKSFLGLPEVGKFDAKESTCKGVHDKLVGNIQSVYGKLKNKL